MPVKIETDVTFWKLRAVDFLIETARLVSTREVVTYRNETLARLNTIAGSDGLHLISKPDEVAELIMYSSDTEHISSFTDTSYFQRDTTTEEFTYHASIQVNRSHFLKKYTSAVYIPMEETFFRGALIFTWTEKTVLPKGFEVFITVVLGRINGVIRTASTKFAAEDLGIKFDALFRTVKQGLIFIEDSGKEAFVNKQAKHILGIDKEGEKFPPIVVSESMRRLIARAENKYHINSTALELFNVAEKKIDDWLWKFSDKIFSVSSSPFISDRIKGRLWVFEDISNLYFANQSLQQANEDIHVKNLRLETLNTEKNDLIGIVSHDLRSPLTQIKILSGFITMDGHPLSADQQATLNRIEEVVDKGIQLIKDLLDISIIEQQQINKKIEKIDLSTVIQATLIGFVPVAVKKNITLQYEQGDTPQYVMADQDFLTRILDNLISNAIKFSHRDKTITVTLVPQHTNTLLLGIKDQGQGIVADEIKKLFGKFSRLSTRPTAKESSSGLGLFIVKSLVEELGGRIWCESVWGEGSTFFVELSRVNA